jgi:hypothetical protein
MYRVYYFCPNSTNHLGKIQRLYELTTGSILPEAVNLNAIYQLQLIASMPSH